MSIPDDIPVVPPDLGPFERWFSVTFQVFSAHAAVWLAQGAIAFAVIVALGGGAIATRWRDPGASVSGFTLGLGLLGGLAALYFVAGMVHSALKALRGEPVGVGDLFTARGQGYAVVAGVVVSLLVGLGWSCCVIPGLILGGLFLLAIPLIVDGAGGLGRSARITRQNIILFSLYFLVLQFGFSLGAATGIGLIAVLPLYAIALAVPYADLTYGLTTPNSAAPPPYTPPPSAS